MRVGEHGKPPMAMSFAAPSGISGRQAADRVAGTGKGGKMDQLKPTTGTGEAAAAIRAGDQSAFTILAQRHRRELLVHCYRMLGSFHDAEDVGPGAFLRAWRYRESLKEGAPLRPGLYRVATNTCLDAIARDPRRSALAPERPGKGRRYALGPRRGDMAPAVSRPPAGAGGTP